MARPSFPKSLAEFQARFSTEKACAAYLLQSRWPDGFVCPRCGGKEAFCLPRRGLHQCKPCGYQVSVTAGTVMQATRTPLVQWFRAAYLMTTLTPGISALQLKRQLGLASYQTAWTMLHKLRRATVNPDREKLRGKVEVDDAYVGGKEEDVVGRQVETKTPVAVAVEVRGRASGRIRLHALSNVSAGSLVPFVQGAVEPGSTVYTDGLSSYKGLKEASYKHRVRPMKGAKDPSKVLRHAHRAVSNLKAWLLGTHHGVSQKHLQPYLDEFAFRFNRRRTPMAAFQTLLGIGSRVATVTYNMLCASEPNG
jgi:transposase-like protein/rubredoxin